MLELEKYGANWTFWREKKWHTKKNPKKLKACVFKNANQY